MRKTPSSRTATRHRDDLLGLVADFPSLPVPDAMHYPEEPAAPVNVVPLRSVEVPLTKQQRSHVEEAGDLIAEIMTVYGKRLRELATILELQGVEGIHPAHLRAIEAACGLGLADIAFRLDQDYCARGKVRKHPAARMAQRAAA